MKTVSVARLHEALSYDAETGSLTWQVETGRRVVKGKEAGSVDKLGYRRIGLDGNYFLAHRAAWALVHGDWPEYEIDHIDGNPSNNSFENLRPATHAENMQNRAVHANNTSGYPGVWFDKNKGSWRAEIHVGGKRVSAGRHKTVDLAIAACAAARISHHTFQPIPRHMMETSA